MELNTGQRNGVGHVLIMHYEDNGTHYYRVSCSTVPADHLNETGKQEQRRGNENPLDLVYFAEVNNMFRAKADVKLVLQGMGLRKDVDRRAAQDWLCGNELPKNEVSSFANTTVEAHNRNNPIRH
jgi:hypothetical protein